MNKDHDFKEYLDHFPTCINKNIRHYATEEVFKFSRYIFTRRQGKRQYGWCTHCREEFETKGLKHNTRAQCPVCKSRCIVKASGIRRSRLIDEAYFVYYEKSFKNPNAIIARGIYAVRDYTSDYWNVETQYLERAWYVFEMGKSVMLAQNGYYSAAGTMQAYSFGECKSVFSMYGHYHNNSLNLVLACSLESIKEAVKDTPFRFSTWESYNDGDMVKFFDLYSKYPCIEYLTKLGFSNLVKEKLAGKRTYSTLNWRGKNLFKVLKIAKQELNLIKLQRIHVTFEFLKVLQMSKKDGSNLTPAEATEVTRVYSAYINELEKLLKYGGLRKITSYLGKQNEKHPKYFVSQTSALITWRDYISDCIKLEMNLSKARVLFPRNLHRAHQNTIKQVKVKADEILNKKIIARVKSLGKYRFEHSGLMIRPAESSNELIAEGKALNHCVGTYANKYAKGETNIFVIRKISEPDKPYFTVEIRQDMVRQVRGKNNCNPSKDVSEFMTLFTEQKLNREKTKIKVKTAVPA